MNKLVVTNLKMMESHQRMADKVVCMEEERRKKQGEFLYSLVNDQKGKVQSMSLLIKEMFSPGVQMMLLIRSL